VGRQAKVIALPATFAIHCVADGPAGMVALLEQQKGGVFLPGGGFNWGKKNPIPGNHKAAVLDKFSQRGPAMDI
jgi:hypothetical protein